MQKALFGARNSIFPCHRSTAQQKTYATSGALTFCSYPLWRCQAGTASVRRICK